MMAFQKELQMETRKAQNLVYWKVQQMGHQMEQNLA